MNTPFRITELEKLIAYHQNVYYNNAAPHATMPAITDSEFDALWDELKNIAPNSAVLKKVGADSGVFPKMRHKMPMGSQEKVANEEAFIQWAKKHAYDEYIVEYKLDGASLELQYENGVLRHAVTRGDGEIGDEITSNAKKMQGVVHRLAQPLTGAVRGEVIMSHNVHEQYFSDKANCRNAANGLMKRKDGSGCEHLSFIAYDARFEETKNIAPENSLPFIGAQAQPFIGEGSQPLFIDEVEKIEFLRNAGFSAVPLKICKTLDDVISYRKTVAQLRETGTDIDYDIDGLVIKERRLDFADAERARPERQVAFKFALEEAISVLRAVEWSESGVTYTPVALFDAVELAGTTVQRASLSNPALLRALGVKIGSRVVVTKRGEIIPKIERIIENPQPDKTLGDICQSEIEFPKTCSACGASLQDDGTRLFCPNPSCPKLIHHRLEKWIAVLDIRDIGEKLIEALFTSKRVRSVSDLYTLTEEELTPYFFEDESIAKGKKSKGAEKVIASINARRTINLASFIAGFDIDGIGETLVEKLVEAGFDTLQKLLDATEEQIAAVNGFGEITAKALNAGLQQNKTEMLFLTNGILALTGIQTGGKLAGLSFCFTGELFSMKRSEAEKKVKENGGYAKSTVVKGLSFLVTNDTASASAKNKKATELGIPIIDEKQFLAMLDE
ncbi:MAG: NAD-dependent DNA ligase LigA [Treponemataceae bacterium]|nr:MAG: NAD-dependent DNA ligase LigA [Treponemataceae bacterium]